MHFIKRLLAGGLLLSTLNLYSCESPAQKPSFAQEARANSAGLGIRRFLSQDPKKANLDVLVLVDSSFMNWFDSLEKRGDFLVEPGAGRDSTYVGNGRPGRYLQAAISHQLELAAAPFTGDKSLTERVGKPLSFRLSGIRFWDYRADLFLLVNSPQFGFVKYNARTLLNDAAGRFPGDSADLIVALTGLDLMAVVEQDSAQSPSFLQELGGMSSGLGEKYVIVQKDQFAAPAKSPRRGASRCLAHEIGHCLGAEHIDSHTPPQFLMDPCPGGYGFQLDPGNVERISTHVRNTYLSARGH